MDTNNLKTVLPGWEAVGLLGRGSFGAVYEIRRQVFDETESAALKVITIPQSESEIEDLRSDGYDDQTITRRFESFLKDIIREYSMMSRLRGCANVVYCDDVKYVQHDDGFGWDIFIKMELLTPLTRALGPTVPEEQVIRIGKDLCKALVTCEEQHVLHRDIKPQNIFVARDGTCKLGDFGVAKAVEHTTGGTKTGTYKYMAPEVYNNRPYGSKADQYSLGLVLYWLLNERRTPFLPLPPDMPNAGDEDRARARRFRGEQIPAPLHGSEELKRIVLKTVAYDPAERFSDAGELLRALEELERRPAADGGAGARNAGTHAAGAVSAGRAASPLHEEEPPTASATDRRSAGTQGYRVPDEDGTQGVFPSGREPAGRPDAASAPGPEPGQAAPPKKSKRGWIFGLCGVLALGLILLLLLLPKNKESKPAPTAAPSPVTATETPTTAEPQSGEDTLTAYVAYELTIQDPDTGSRAVRCAETNLGDLCADAFLTMPDADIAILNGGGIRASIPAGEISTELVQTVFSFNNTACLAEVSGQQILDALEMGARRFPDENGGFLQVAGLRYEIHSSLEPNVSLDDSGMWVGPGDKPYRVQNVQVLNRSEGSYEPLDLTGTYKLASNSYLLLDRGDSMGMFGADNIRVLQDQGQPDSELLMQFLLSFPGSGEYAHQVTGYEDPRGAGRITVVPEEPVQSPEELLAQGFSESSDGLFWKLEDGVLTIAGQGEMTSTPWIWNKEEIQSVCVLNGVTSIRESAFVGWDSLTSVTIPSSVTSIGKEAFYNCKSLSSVTIPAGVTSIGDKAFYQCTSLSSVTIPAGVTSIGDKAFCQCTSLTSITIPDGVASIGSAAFSGCENLTSVTIPDGVASIGSAAFGGCTSLTSITIPGSVTSIEKSTFYNCTNLKTVTICSGVASIGESAFQNCESLTAMTIPGSVVSIGDQAFRYCTSLSDLSISDGTASIGKEAFWSCDSLTSLTIPGSVVSMGENAFSSCDGLESLIILDGVTAIGRDAFSSCNSLKSVTLPNSVTTIGDSAFNSCKNLTSVNIPNSVATIDSMAFFCCKSLPAVTIPEGVVSIGDGAFDSCDSLTSVTIPASVTTMERNAFAACDKLTSIAVADGNPAFLSVEGVLFSRDMKTLIGYPAGKSDASYSVPAGVAVIGDYAFYGCRGLTNVTIPAGVTEIGSSAFGFCENLPAITLPAGVTRIGASAFWSCTRMTSVTLPASVTSIERDAFAGQTQLKDIYYAGTQAQWQAISFGKDWKGSAAYPTVHYHAS